MRRLAAFLISLVALAATLWWFRVPTTVAVLWDIADGPAGRGGHRGAEPARSTVSVDVSGRPLPADLYAPADPGGAGLVLLPGLTAQGKADERLVDFALNLARAGFTVLVPDLSGRATLSAGTADVPEILATVAHLSDRLGGRQVGLVGISYAVGPAILAALEPAGRERVATLVSFGGYHDLTHMVAWVTTGQRRGPDGAWIKGSVPDLAVWFFVAGNVRLLNDPIDRHLLNEMARRRWNDATVPVGDLAARLGPEGQAVFALLTNRDPEAVPSLIGTLPERLRAELAALDLSKRDLKALPARLVLVHGKDDPVIPWTESVSLAAATDPARTDLFLIGKMGHTEVGGIGLSDALDLWRAISAVLGERERLEEQTGPRASGTGAGR